MTQLRQRLQQITDEAPVERHPAQVEALRAEFGHTIQVVESELPISGYTCGVHSFGLIDDPTYRDVAGFGCGKTFAGAEFVQFLLANGLLEEKVAGVAGDLVIYFDGVAFKHVGRMAQDGRILSKWGQGYLYNHQVWEVPLDYGQVVRYFQGPGPDQGLDLFIAYAQSKGFQFET